MAARRRRDRRRSVTLPTARAVCPADPCCCFLTHPFVSAVCCAPVPVSAQAIQRAMEAAVEAQYRGMLMQRQLEEERAATVQHNRANKQRLQQQQQQQQSRPRAQL